MVIVSDAHSPLVINQRVAIIVIERVRQQRVRRSLAETGALPSRDASGAS